MLNYTHKILKKQQLKKNLKDDIHRQGKDSVVASIQKYQCLESAKFKCKLKEKHRISQKWAHKGYNLMV